MPTFELGIPFRLFEASVEEAEEYVGEDVCTLCSQRGHCFRLGIGDEGDLAHHRSRRRTLTLRSPTLDPALLAGSSNLDATACAFAELARMPADGERPRELADTIANDDAFLRAYPEVSWWLARPYFHEFAFGPAVEWADRYLESTR